MKTTTSYRATAGPADAVVPLTREQQCIVTAHMHMAEEAGRRYAALGMKKGLPVDDLIQEAMYALCLATSFYHEGRGETFKQYARRWCLRAVKRAINQERRLDSLFDLFVSEQTAERVAEEDAQEHQEEIARREQRFKYLDRLIRRLPDARYRQVVRMASGLRCRQKSFAQIAQKLGISIRWAHELYDQALTEMETRDSKH